MKRAWVVLLASALTDFFITSITSLLAAMMSTGNAEMPSKAVLLVCALGGLLAFMRTVQQALKATPESTAALLGDVSLIQTYTEQSTPKDLTKETKASAEEHKTILEGVKKKSGKGKDA